eukprot:jgi/Hompol1/4513/HPOL_003677-RA
MAHQRTADIDYSEIFPSGIGRTVGSTIFRIESLHPVVQDEDLHGLLCVADCYIVLVTKSTKPIQTGSKHAKDEVDFESSSDNLEHEIYTWIGSQAEMDKKFCCAMFAVGLRNWIGASCRIKREVEDEESPEFLSVFSKTVEYEDASQATESCLYMAEEKRYPLRLYKMHGKTDLQLALVQTTYSSLRSDAVYILDWGLEIYQWNGSKSPLQHRVKCRIICERINKLERIGRAEIVEFDEWEESERFWDILGGQRTQEDADRETADQDHENSETSSGIDKHSDNDEDSEERREEKYFEKLAYSPATLYRVFPKIAPEIESHIVAVGKLRRAVLFSDGCYILDAGVELFLWLGKNAWPQLRSMATELLAKIASSQKRPAWIALNRCVDQHEPEVFKLRFRDWDTVNLDSINWRDVSLGLQSEVGPLRASVMGKPGTAGNSSSTSGNPNINSSGGGSTSASAKPKVTVDVKALYAPPPNLDFDSLMIEETIEHANIILQAFTCFVYSRGRFVQLPEAERGHFFSHDAYVFLRLAFSTFKLKTQYEMEQLVEQMYDSPVRVVQVEQGREPIALLAHLNNMYVLRSGSRTDWLLRMEAKVAAAAAASSHVSSTSSSEETADNKIGTVKLRPAAGKSQASPAVAALFHIRTDLRYKTTRAIEVPATAESLVSRDCFFLQSLDAASDFRSSLWIGRGASKDEIARARLVSEMVLDLHRQYEGVSDDAESGAQHEVKEHIMSPRSSQIHDESQVATTNTDTI